jgi:hypothetical protein
MGDKEKKEIAAIKTIFVTRLKYLALGSVNLLKDANYAVKEYLALGSVNLF